MAKNDTYKRMAEQLKADVKEKAKARAKTLFGATPPGYKDVGKAALLEMVRRNWDDPGYRQGLLTRIGPENFRETVIAMYGGDESVWPMPEGGPQHG